MVGEMKKMKKKLTIRQNWFQLISPPQKDSRLFFEPHKTAICSTFNSPWKVESY